MSLRARLIVLLCAAATACGPSAHQYPVVGQIIGVSTERHELTIHHKDIPNFMPSMTMAYAVKDPAELQSLTPGDLVTATLVLRGSEVYLQGIHKTGHAPVPTGSHPIMVLDVMKPGDTVPDDRLRDQSGTPRKLSDWRGKALAVTFIYTRCPLPDFCPLMDHQFAAVQQAVARDAALRGRVHLVSVSFDPAHDTPAVLKQHAAGLHADPAVWSFLTGEPVAVSHVAERFGVSVIDEKDAPQTLTHNLRTAVVDPEGRVTTIYSGNEWRPAQMLDAMKHALAQ
jgi:protein SCO1/2